MERREALQIIDATLRHAGFRPIGPRPVDYTGQIHVNGKPVDVLLSIPDVRFAAKPQVFLTDRSQIPLEILAHVEEGTGICYTSGAGLPLDLYKPGEAILRVLEDARRTLEMSYKGKGRAELIDEYQAYWKSELSVRCLIPRHQIIDGTEASLFIAKSDGKAKFMGIANEAALRGYETIPAGRVLFWKTQRLLGPVGAMITPSTLPDLKSWLKGHADLGNRNWLKLIGFLTAGNSLFIAAPNALAGLRLTLPADLKFAAANGKIRPNALPAIVAVQAARVGLDKYSGRWSSLNDVADRNNPNIKDLSAISIALIGCGTIGSHLARMLVQTGAGASGRLTLFDNQHLSDGNIGRHLLGFADIGKPKAPAVTEEVLRFHPQVEIASYQQDALEHLDILGKHDLVIDATGEWNVQSALNEWFLSDAPKQTAALLHCWVFMNGAGVQSFLNQNDGFACFRCLKPVFEGQWRFPVGDEKEELNLRPATCGDGSFVPFTVDAPVTAASLACRAAIDWVNARPSPRLRSAVIDQRRGRKQDPRNPTPAKDCPACSARRADRQ